MRRSKWFKRAGLWVAAVGLALTSGMLPPREASASISDADLAYRWAPVHYQDTDSSNYAADYLSGVDYDGEWNTLNNWDNLTADPNRLQGKAYYSVVETSTHWFIGYNFYHPRDWTDVDFFGVDQHENDMEGILLTVRKDGSTYGALEAMVTVSHTDFYSYVPAGSPYTNGQEDIDGTVRMMNVGGVDRPVTFQEAKGHGIHAWNGDSYSNTDVVLYFPSLTESEVPSGGNDRDVKYQLVDIFEYHGLWDHRYDPQTFHAWGTFRGDNGATKNGANAPWGYDDKNDGPGRGEIATDPAKLVANYFNNRGNFSLTYIRNPFQVETKNRLEASNIAGAFIRHASDRIRIDTNVDPYADSEWLMVPGLADSNGVSFLSVNYPGHYLRHRDGGAWKDAYTDSDLFRADATFYIRPGLANAGLVSFESYNFPGRYLRHRDSLLFNEPISTDLDKQDATFKMY